MSSKIERIRIASAFKKAEWEQSRIDRVAKEIGADVIAEARKVEVYASGDVWLKFPWKQWIRVRVLSENILIYAVDGCGAEDFPDAIEKASEFSAAAIILSVVAAVASIIATACVLAWRFGG